MAAEHVVIILGTSYFPQKTEVEEGDVVRFVNVSGREHIVVHSGGKWMTMPMDDGEELLVTIQPDMTARLYVDGEPQDVPAVGNVSLTLDRGEHKVYAELLDARKRRIVATETVTFFVHQHSVGFGRPAASPGT